MNIVKHKNIFLSFSALLIIAGWIAVFVFGLNSGIDLKGGTRWTVSFPHNEATSESIRLALLPELGDRSFSVNSIEGDLFVVRLPSTSEEEHQRYLAILESLGSVQEEEFSSIGPTVGAELRKNAVWAIILVLFGISTYTAWAFRKVSRPIASWKYGLATLVTLFHDVSIPLGLLAFLGVEIDTNIIVSLLVVMGFSVHDTIVVFDRIRENVKMHWRKNVSFGDIVNRSVQETIARSLNTSLTLIFVLVALLIWGPESLFYFLLALLVGTVAGTYSSIFVASPLLFLWRGRE